MLDANLGTDLFLPDLDIYVQRVAQELRDRGYGSRYGYAWTVRVATEALAQVANT